MPSNDELKSDAEKAQEELRKLEPSDPMKKAMKELEEHDEMIRGLGESSDAMKDMMQTIEESEALRASIIPDSRKDDSFPPPDLGLGMPHVPPAPPPPEPAKKFYYELRDLYHRVKKELDEDEEAWVCHCNECGKETRIVEFSYRNPDLMVMSAEDRVILAHVASLQMTVRKEKAEPGQKRDLGSPFIPPDE